MGIPPAHGAGQELNFRRVGKNLPRSPGNEVSKTYPETFFYVMRTLQKCWDKANEKGWGEKGPIHTLHVLNLNPAS